jgi:6-phosphofructokinase 1
MHPHKEQSDRSAALRATADLDALIVVGGDGSLRSAAKLANHIWAKRPEFIIAGVPKTIDNDVAATEAAIGFASAVQRAQDACDAASTTARSHRRILVVEVMGRHSGALAAAVALTGSAQRCVIPESVFDPETFVRWAHEHPGSVVVVAEGAKIPGGPAHAYDNEGWIRPGFPSLLLAELLAAHEVPARSVVLGHVLRGGPPVAADRELGAALGVQAATDVLAGRSNLAVFRSGHVTSVALAEAIQEPAPLHDITLTRLQQLGRC